MEVLVRRAAVEDADGLGAAHVAAWRAAYSGLIPDDHLAALDPVAGAERWRSRIEAADSELVTIVARVGDRVAGFATYGPPQDQVAEFWGQLWAINLHPDFWRKGIGTRLFAGAVRGLADLGYRHGYLWVLQGNERAIAFYRRQGWLPDGVIKIEYRFGPPLTELRCCGVLDEPNPRNGSC